jgi:hypothetical protein
MMYSQQLSELRSRGDRQAATSGLRSESCQMSSPHAARRGQLESMASANQSCCLSLTRPCLSTSSAAGKVWAMANDDDEGGVSTWLAYAVGIVLLVVLLPFVPDIVAWVMQRR